MTFRKNKVLGLVGATIVAFTPSAASAASFTVAVKVAGVMATGIGLVSDTLTLSSLTNWNNLSDDHPLYSSGDTSPKLTISATETTFNLFLDQPLEIGETVDDEPVTISGIAKIDDPKGEVDAWAYNLTFTYEKNIHVVDTLGVSGTLQHIRAPHPELGEIQKAPALDVDADLAQTPPPFPSPPKPITVNGMLDMQKHNDGPHYDVMTENRLEATCCTSLLGNFTKWEYRLVADHGKSVPEPSSTLSLLALGTLSAASTLKRKLKSPKPSEKETTKVS
jgi:hypothetical protein